MIRIEVQQDPQSESVAWEIDGPWDADLAASLVEGIEDIVSAAENLGISLWDAMAPKAAPGVIEFQMSSRPKYKRCLTFKVGFRRPEGELPISRGAQADLEADLASHVG